MTSKTDPIASGSTVVSLIKVNDDAPRPAVLGLANGIPGPLDGSGKLPAGQVPATGGSDPTALHAANNLSDVANAAAALAALAGAPLASPALTGSPTAPTKTALDNSTKLATTAYADSAVGVETSARASAITALSGVYASLTGASFSGDVHLYRRPFIDLKARGAYCDGTTHPLSGRFATLTDAQAAYPNAGITALTQEIDWAALSDAINSLPTSGPDMGGAIGLYGSVYLGSDGIVSTASNVRLIGLSAKAFGGSVNSKGCEIVGTGTQVLLTIGQAGATNWDGWSFEHVRFRDPNGTLTGLVRLIRKNRCTFTDCSFAFSVNTATGYAVQMDGTGDTCQYTTFINCWGYNVPQGYTYVSRTDDTVILGGGLQGNGQSGSVGVWYSHSMRVIGANVQWFERNHVVDGVHPVIDVIRSDGHTGTTVHIDVLATASDATIIAPKFANTYPSIGHIRLNTGHTRTAILFPTSDGTSMVWANESGTYDQTVDPQLTLLSSLTSGLVLSGSSLKHHASGVLQAIKGTAGFVKAGTISDADFASTPPDGSLGVDTTDGTFMYRSGGGWKSVAPLATSPVGKVGSVTAETSVANTTTETVLGTVTMAAGAAAAGSVLRIRAAGKIDNIATSGQITIRVKVGSTTVAAWILGSFGTAVTGKGWQADATATFRTAGSSASVVGGGNMIANAGSASQVGTAYSSLPFSGTVNSTTSETVTVTAQFATADVANVCYLEQMLVELA